MKRVSPCWRTVRRAMSVRSSQAASASSAAPYSGAPQGWFQPGQQCQPQRRDDGDEQPLPVRATAA
jgi:hypothetical protein